MITGGSFRNEKFVLAAESDNDAEIIKRGLCGKTDAMAIAPYGNKVNVSAQDNTLLIFKKQSGRPLTYEEAHTLIKKIQLFEKVSEKMVNFLQREARIQLDAQLTLFYPSPNAPVMQIAFSYNWVAFETERNDFAHALPAVHDAIVLSKGETNLKAFSNGTNTISIHNYDMGGIYVPRRALEAIAGTAQKHGLIRPDERNRFVLRTAAFGVHAVSYMEARHLCQNVDETFELGDEKNYNPLIGKQEFIMPMMESLHLLAETGDFSALSKEQLARLRGPLVSPDFLREFALSDTIGYCFATFVKDFAEEIGTAYKNSR